MAVPRFVPGTARLGLRVAVPLFCLALLPACEADDPCGPSRGVVARVIDGDTVELESGLKIRYLDVDTPESTSEVECFGEESAAFNESLVLGREVRLTYERQCVDRQGRTLAHVWVDDQPVGLTLVTNGYGCAFLVAPNDEQRVRFEDAEAYARAWRLGLWGACADAPPC